MVVRLRLSGASAARARRLYVQVCTEVWIGPRTGGSRCVPIRIAGARLLDCVDQRRDISLVDPNALAHQRYGSCLLQQGRELPDLDFGGGVHSGIISLGAAIPLGRLAALVAAIASPTRQRPTGADAGRVLGHERDRPHAHRAMLRLHLGTSAMLDLVASCLVRRRVRWLARPRDRRLLAAKARADECYGDLVIADAGRRRDGMAPQTRWQARLVGGSVCGASSRSSGIEPTLR